MDKKLGVKLIKHKKSIYRITSYRFPYCLKEYWNYISKRMPFKFKYGFDYQDCWNIDSSFIDWIYPRLLYWRAKMNSYPNELTFEEWESIIDEMIQAIEDWKNDNYINGNGDRFNEKFLNNFHKYFHHLWD